MALATGVLSAADGPATAREEHRAALITTHAAATRLPFFHQGPFVRLADGSILGADPNGVLLTQDEGNTWELKRILDSQRFEARPERALFRTRKGTLLFAFLNARERVSRWDQDKGGPQEGSRIPMYVTRSEDEGKTWIPPALLQDGWCGAVRNIIQLGSGRIVLVSQIAVRDPGRHVSLTYVSDDDGLSWRPSNRIDLGEYGTFGDHGGGIEGTVIERRDGSLWMLLRTPQGRFSEVVSKDGGETWLASRPSAIPASPAPGTLLRMSDGRVALAWNRWAEQGADPATGRGRRNEMSLSFSSDDGATWTRPIVMARAPLDETVEIRSARDRTNDISYYYLFEVKPGTLWITTMRGALRISLPVQNLVK